MEETTAYKVISTVHLHGFWFIDRVDYVRGWHGEGIWKKELKLSKFDCQDVLLCIITSETIEIHFTCKKFKQEYVDKMDEIIEKEHKWILDKPKKLIVDDGMPETWFSKTKNSCIL